MASLVCGSLYLALVALAGPLFLSPPSFRVGCRCYLLHSPSLLPALSLGALYIGALALSGLPVLLLLPFSLYLCFCFASASLLPGYSGILARVFSTFLLSRLPLSRRSPLPFQLFASWLLVSPFVSFSTFLGVILRSPDSMRLCASSSFFPFLSSSGMSYSILFLLLVSCAFYLWPLIISSASPFSVLYLILLFICGFGLFFLCLCRLILIRLPLPVLVGSPCHPSLRSLPRLGLPSCCSFFVGSFMFSSLTASLVDC